MRPAAEPRGFASAAGAAAHVFAPELADEVTIDGPDGHHLERVRRLRAGERVTVADGSGAWRAYTISSTGRGQISLAVDGPRTHEPLLTPRLGVAFGVGKGTKPELVVAALTELGVDRIIPFLGARAVVRWEGARAAGAVARLVRVARESAMQCRRARIPEIADPVGLDGLVTGGMVVVGDPTGQPPESLVEPVGGEWLAVVGAEGGLAPDEVAALRARPGSASIAVGPHVLRTETAAIAVAAVLAGRRGISDDRLPL